MSVFESHRWLGSVLRFGVSASLIIWMLGRAELDRVGQVLRAADVALITVAFASYFVGYAVSVARWRALLAVQGIRPRFSYLYWSFMIGVFFNQLLPTTVGGDVARYQYTAAGGRGAALSAVLLDRVFGTAALLLFTITGLALTWGSGTVPRALLAPVAALVVLGLLVIGCLLLFPGAALGLLRHAGPCCRVAGVTHSKNCSCFCRLPRSDRCSVRCAGVVARSSERGPRTLLHCGACARNRRVPRRIRAHRAAGDRRHGDADLDKRHRCARRHSWALARAARRRSQHEPRIRVDPLRHAAWTGAVGRLGLRSIEDLATRASRVGSV